MSRDIMSTAPVNHPAKYTNCLLPVFADMVRGSKRILDPMAGTGKIFDLARWLPDIEIQGVELEPEWAALCPRTTLGNALLLPWIDGYFDAICVSPAYGNRMADCHNAKDDSRRNTYTHTIGRKLHPDNSGAMQWGAKYRAFHVKAWAEASRVLSVGGKFVLNIKDHIRNGERMHVTNWHIDGLCGLGFEQVEHYQICTPGNRYGENAPARIPYESVILFRKVQ